MLTPAVIAESSWEILNPVHLSLQGGRKPGSSTNYLLGLWEEKRAFRVYVFLGRLEGYRGL